MKSFTRCIYAHFTYNFSVTRIVLSGLPTRAFSPTRNASAFFWARSLQLGTSSHGGVHARTGTNNGRSVDRIKSVTLAPIILSIRRGNPRTCPLSVGGKAFESRNNVSPAKAGSAGLDCRQHRKVSVRPGAATRHEPLDCRQSAIHHFATRRYNWTFITNGKSTCNREH